MVRVQPLGKLTVPNASGLLPREREELQRAIQTNQAAMQQVREKYAADKARFRELTGK